MSWSRQVLLGIKCVYKYQDFNKSGFKFNKYEQLISFKSEIKVENLHPLQVANCFAIRNL